MTHQNPAVQRNHGKQCPYYNNL